MRTAMKWLAASERGVIVAGGGVLRARASRRLVALAEALAVPVMASWRRPDVFPNDHPLYLGMTGYASPSTVRERLEDADVVMVLGARLSEVASFEYALPHGGQRWIHVDLAPRTAHAGLAAPDLAIAADALRFIDSALSLLRAAALDAEMRDRRSARTAADHEAWLDASRVGGGDWQGPGVHPGRTIETLRAVLPENAILTSDAGNIAGWLARGFRFLRPGTFIGATAGSMGFGLPAAIAASLHEPDRVCVAICGDGGFAMTMSDLETAVREGARPIVLVFDNLRYGTIAMHQTSDERPTRTSELGPIDFAMVARAMGALGIDGRIGRGVRAGIARSDGITSPCRTAHRPRPGVGVRGRDAHRQDLRSSTIDPQEVSLRKDTRVEALIGATSADRVRPESDSLPRSRSRDSRQRRPVSCISATSSTPCTSGASPERRVDASILRIEDHDRQRSRAQFEQSDPRRSHEPWARTGRAVHRRVP